MQPTLIDPNEYVEAAEGTLQFGDQTQQGKFELGVCMAIYKWEELATAVDNNWGGPQLADKRDWISGVVIDLFTENKIVDIQLIEDTLLYAMADEFDTEVDNDSALEIGALVFKLYQECAQEKYDTVDALYQAYQEKQAYRAKHLVELQADPNNPSDSDDDSDDDEEDHDHHHHQHDNQGHLHTHHEDLMDVDDGPVVDDDGFELVQSKRKGRR